MRQSILKFWRFVSIDDDADDWRRDDDDDDDDEDDCSVISNFKLGTLTNLVDNFYKWAEI